MTAQTRLELLRRELKPAPLSEQVQHVRDNRLSTAKPMGRKQLAKMRAAWSGMELEELRGLAEELEQQTEGAEQ